ncbi:hypothetical protein [Streptomyces sennicomposti]
MTARETLVTTLTNLLALSRRGRMDAHRAEAERLVDDVLHEAAEEIRAETESLKAAGVLEPDKFRPCRDAAWQIDPRCPGAGFDELLAESEQRAEAKRKARTYPYDLEVGQ